MIAPGDRPPRFTDGIGNLARWQLEQMMKDTPAVARRRLAPGLRAFERAVEGICPAAIKATASGVVTHYGPFLEGDTRQLFALVAADGKRTAARIVASEWPPVTDATILKVRSLTPTSPDWRGPVGGAFIDALFDDNMTVAIHCLSYLLHNQQQDAIARCREVTAEGFLPMVTALVGGKRGAKLSMNFSVIALPPSIDLTLAETGGSS
jgi:hypothetical protein